MARFGLKASSISSLFCFCCVHVCGGSGLDSGEPVRFFQIELAIAVQRLNCTKVVFPLGAFGAFEKV